MLTISAASQILGGVHAHVQRRVVGVGEAPLPGVDLHRRHAEVHVDQVRPHALLAQQRQAFDEVCVDEARVTGDLGREFGEALLGEWIAVDPDQGAGSADAVGYEAGVAGSTNGAVDGHRPGRRVEELDQLAGQDGHVRRGHVNQCGQSSR